MKNVGLVYDGRYCLHVPPPDHPERPERLLSVIRHIRESGLEAGLLKVPAVQPPESAIRAVHSQRHIDFIRTVSANGGGMLDGGDTHASERSFEVALLAAGGVMAGVDAVAGGSLDAVFCAVRPPGHHAEQDDSMGFCLFNNVAIGVRHAQQRHGKERVAVLDWDVHHGNGTQHIFEDDPTVLFISLHQYPFYPGTGARSERGAGRGEGFTMNFPFSAGTGEESYLGAMRGEIVPALERFRPDLLFISAGFDAHRDDPLGGMELTGKSFAAMTRLVRDIAPVISVLEGGYNLAALEESVEFHLHALQES